MSSERPDAGNTALSESASIISVFIFTAKPRSTPKRFPIGHLQSVRARQRSLHSSGNILLLVEGFTPLTRKLGASTFCVVMIGHMQVTTVVLVAVADEA